jgi:hypothetical protein
LDVSIGLLSLRLTNCPFAVKSGGHAAFLGASNIDGGVTIDLVNMNNISVDAAGVETQIGPGNRWDDVYTNLEKRGLSVIGGRVSDIGVGGLTLGGGISFFSGRFGWACVSPSHFANTFPCLSYFTIPLKSKYPVSKANVGKCPFSRQC